MSLCYRGHRRHWHLLIRNLLRGEAPSLPFPRLPPNHILPRVEVGARPGRPLTMDRDSHSISLCDAQGVEVASG